MAQIDFFLAYVTVDNYDVPRLFILPDNVFAEKGDLIEYEGEMFLVTDRIYMDKTSAEYRLICDLTHILDAQAVYSRRWSKDDD